MEIRDVKSLERRRDAVGKGASVTPLYPSAPFERALLSVDLLELEPGGETTLDSHGEEHVLFVIRGSGQLRDQGSSGPSATVRVDSVVHLAAHEAYVLSNTGGERLRALVTTPLLAWSDRALGITTAQPAVAEPAHTDLPPRPVERAVGGSDGRSGRSEVTAAQEESVTASEPNETEQEEPLPDISQFMKRGSEIAAIPRPERRRPEPAPEPEPEPVPAVQEEPEEGDEEDGQHLMELNIVFDGGSRGNPGQGYGSYLVQSPGRRPVIKRVEFGNNYTNNQAEYDTLIRCLEYVVDRLTATNRSPAQVALDIKSDSDLLVNQINGQYKVKDAGLRKRHEQASALLEQFGAWLITWHPREESVRLLGH